MGSQFIVAVVKNVALSSLEQEEVVVLSSRSSGGSMLGDWRRGGCTIRFSHERTTKMPNGVKVRNIYPLNNSPLIQSDGT